MPSFQWRQAFVTSRIMSVHETSRRRLMTSWWVDIEVDAKTLPRCRCKEIHQYTQIHPIATYCECRLHWCRISKKISRISSCFLVSSRQLIACDWSVCAWPDPDNDSLTALQTIRPRFNSILYNIIDNIEYIAYTVYSSAGVLCLSECEKASKFCVSTLYYAPYTHE